MTRNKTFLKKAIKHPGRVTRYLRETYGGAAFDERGRLKLEYLDMAEKRAHSERRYSLERAIVLAKRLHKGDFRKR